MSPSKAGYIRKLQYNLSLRLTYSVFMKYLFLLIAIISEVIATSALKQANSFTRLGPSIIVVIGYGVAFYFLSLTLKSMPVGIAYAVWSGVGILLISAIGAIFYKQMLDLPAIIGLSFIIIGVIIVNVFSKMSAH